MKSILKMILCRWRAKVEYVGKAGNGVCYHITLPDGATEDDIYAAKEAVHSVGYTCMCFHTNHNGTPQLGAFSEC